MYCPKCGEVMREDGGTYECALGKMQLSPDMALHLFASFVARTEEPEDFALRDGSSWGGNWFCPGCGVPMQEEVPGAVRCPQCGRNLGKYIYRLVELHPHLNREI